MSRERGHTPQSKAFLQQLKVNDPIQEEDYIAAVRGAIKDRAKVIYFILKALEKMHPEIDAKAVITQGIRDFGLYQSKTGWKNVTNAKEAMIAMSSKPAIIALDQDYYELQENHAKKVVHDCALIEAYKEMGLSKEEIRELCQEVLMCVEYAIFDDHKDAFAYSLPTMLTNEGQEELGCTYEFTAPKTK
ncbi:MAG: hypothetical protein LBR25_00970 [Erysipelotrichaceae bacterium]|jgi:DNA-binding transcriptional regulator YhcF (GntR family)|nr:hypothetical protein [Erysipelotrichaceae bacterium]